MNFEIEFFLFKLGFRYRLVRFKTKPNLVCSTDDTLLLHIFRNKRRSVRRYIMCIHIDAIKHFTGI